MAPLLVGGADPNAKTDSSTYRHEDHAEHHKHPTTLFLRFKGAV